MKPLNDQEAISSYNNGDSAAFRVLYERYAARGLSYAQSILRNRSDSEEALQEAFCRLLGPIRSGGVDAGKGGFGALFFGTIRNLSIDMIRRRRTATSVSLEAVAEPAAETAEAKAAAPETLERTVREALDVLPVHHADAFKLRLNAGLSYDQIAEVLGCTRNQVRSWIYRARRRLEKEFRLRGLLDERRKPGVGQARQGGRNDPELENSEP